MMQKHMKLRWSGHVNHHGTSHDDCHDDRHDDGHNTGNSHALGQARQPDSKHVSVNCERFSNKN